MAETKQTVEREYVIPLRSSWKNVPRYKKTSKSIKTIKEFVAKHMKVPDRDTNKVKLDLYLNNELWLRGAKKPPSKIKIKARKEGELIKVELVDLHENMKFAKAREEKFHKKVEKKEVQKEVGPVGLSMLIIENCKSSSVVFSFLILSKLSFIISSKLFSEFEELA